MLPAVNGVVVVCLGLLAVLVVAETLVHRRYALGAGQLLVLGLIVLLLRLTNGFPEINLRQHFGPGDDPLLVIVLIFICVIAGMAARYFFFMRQKFSWVSLLKPILVSPIVLLPLLGTLHTSSEMTSLQVVSFCFLGFQNGFFWRVIFERSQKSLEGSAN